MLGVIADDETNSDDRKMAVTTLREALGYGDGAVDAIVLED